MENLTVYVKETYFYFLSKIPSVEELVLGGLKKNETRGSLHSILSSSFSNCFIFRRRKVLPIPIKKVYPMLMRAKRDK